MRLSEAIRAGARKTGPCTKSFGNAAEGERGVTCAVGAAYWAATGEFYVEGSVGGPGEHFPMLHEVQFNTDCPMGCEGRKGIYRMLAQNIYHLNDDHLWTRDQIADWVQAQEAIHGIGIEAPAVVREPMRELVGA